VSVPSVERHIGQYKILRTLGAGGMGTVHLGEHVLLGRRAAIKTLLSSLSSHREIVDRFFNEARAISAISDPGVVSIFDFGYHVDGTAYIVMEFLAGESLAARLDRQGKLSVVDALRLARQLSSSLGAAHTRGIVHRDLKPGNVFLVRDPEVQGGERTKILDFGICKLGEPDGVMTTQTGTMLGTPVYMSPEQCRGAGRVDHRADIYSLGCVLFHMLTGRPPFDCDSVGEYIAAHLKEPPPAATAIVPELPPALDTLMARCLAKRPDDRFQSMAELQAAIEQVLASASDGDAVVPLVPKQVTTPLGEGFKSSYDVNLGNKLRTVDQTPSPPSHPWFVDSLAPVELSSHYDVEKSRVSWAQRFALLLALLLGIAGGLIGTNYALERRDDVGDAIVAPGPPAVPPAIDDPLVPAIAESVREVAPPEPVAEESEPARDVAIAEPPRDARPAKQTQSRASRAKPSNSRRPSRVIEREAPEPSEPEDLYDTR
jgi:serine/threonine protein kinase